MQRTLRPGLGSVAADKVKTDKVYEKSASVAEQSCRKANAATCNVLARLPPGDLRVTDFGDALGLWGSAAGKRRGGGLELRGRALFIGDQPAGGGCGRRRSDGLGRGRQRSRLGRAERDGIERELRRSRQERRVDRQHQRFGNRSWK
jgi:hypothetical protein